MSKKTMPPMEGVGTPAKKKKNRRKSSGPRSVEAAPRSDHQKDSTQQKSRMKPYYISHED